MSTLKAYGDAVVSIFQLSGDEENAIIEAKKQEVDLIVFLNAV